MLRIFDYKLGIDRRFRLPRYWSNRELAKFAPLFEGHVVNASAWKDEDKEGTHYRDYFVKANTYWITNWKSQAKGFQGYENEIFLDLEQDLPHDLLDRFDVVFNHTTLEHIFDARKAFQNICLMTRDVVIVCVPFLQPYHTNYGDYWRFSPLAVRRLFKKNGLEVLYLSYNDHRMSSVYVFAIGSKQPEKWKAVFADHGSLSEDTWLCDTGVGYAALTNLLHKIRKVPRRMPSFIEKKSKDRTG
ncbi:hypothetical protein SAMN02746041_00366 [Desulfacinum hydrothermale DSM 13146]|uniref:Methyltransferase domain-containing protein n=1 Tax=Desulfacinum hydrothermale DSM 13146 TaxID=1121390 RepID=A0A1W1X149_9BACT|nr:hypothetical protein [Desulfacinum hydrothermale]SMC17672.1 hypothetical protein SAMN02746041_00366 [Desulfacinum hydrothermale DSM 13146]